MAGTQKFVTSLRGCNNRMCNAVQKVEYKCIICVASISKYVIFCNEHKQNM